MPTKQTDKKPAEPKKTKAPAKEKNLAAKRSDLDESGGGDSKNASATGN
jgi:hypothetical protein